MDIEKKSSRHTQRSLSEISSRESWKVDTIRTSSSKTQPPHSPCHNLICHPTLPLYQNHQKRLPKALFKSHFWDLFTAPNSISISLTTVLGQHHLCLFIFCKYWMYIYKLLALAKLAIILFSFYKYALVILISCLPMTQFLNLWIKKTKSILSVYTKLQHYKLGRKLI